MFLNNSLMYAWAKYEDEWRHVISYLDLIEVLAPIQCCFVVSSLSFEVTIMVISIPFGWKLGPCSILITSFTIML